MFRVDPITKRIDITRGDIGKFAVKVKCQDGTLYNFIKDDVIRLKVFEAKNCNNVVLKKDVVITNKTDEAIIELDSKDTKIGDIINSKSDYWYEIELNPDTHPQTIIGYEYNEELKQKEPKIFRLLPEGGE